VAGCGELANLPGRWHDEQPRAAFASLGSAATLHCGDAADFHTCGIAAETSSAHSCPWDLTLYGGNAEWFRLLGPESATAGPGRSWPGRHGSSGFALIAGYFAFRDFHLGWARLLPLAADLLLGSVMALVQIMRGAHFLSLNLWSLWIVWAVCSMVYFSLQPAIRYDKPDVLTTT
jgi:membrane-associated PAP2 superfamily phosphatase